MEFTTNEYKRSVWSKVFTTSDGNKYIQSKNERNLYLPVDKRTFLVNACKGTSKLNCETAFDNTSEGSQPRCR